MKEIRETKMVEQTTVRYVSDDGEEFSDGFSCKAHEEALCKEIAFEKFNKLVKYEFMNPFDTNESFKFIEINSDDDIIALLAYGDIFYLEGLGEMYRGGEIKIGNKYKIFEGSDYSYIGNIIYEYDRENCSYHSIFDWSKIAESAKNIAEYLKDDVENFKSKYPEYEVFESGRIFCKTKIDK